MRVSVSKYSRQQSFSASGVGFIISSKVGQESFFFHSDSVAEDKERGNYNNEETECRAKHYPKGGTLQKQTGVGRMAHKTVRTGLHDSVIGRYGHVYREETAQVHDGPPA
jgi:hypothetical protein